MVALFGVQRAIAVRGHGRGSQVIAEEVGRRVTAYAHRYTLTAGVVVLDHRGCAAGPLEVGADVVGGHAVQHGVDAVAGAEDRATQGKVRFAQRPERRSGNGATGSGRFVPPRNLSLGCTVGKAINSSASSLYLGIHRGKCCYNI